MSDHSKLVLNQIVSIYFTTYTLCYLYTCRFSADLYQFVVCSSDDQTSTHQVCLVQCDNNNSREEADGTRHCDARIVKCYGQNDLNEPSHLALHDSSVVDEQRIFVADTGNNRIVVLDFSLRLLYLISESFAQTTPGGASIQLHGPRTLFFDGTRNLLYVGQISGSILEFNLSSMNFGEKEQQQSSTSNHLPIPGRDSTTDDDSGSSIQYISFWSCCLFLIISVVFVFIFAK